MPQIVFPKEFRVFPNLKRPKQQKNIPATPKEGWGQIVKEAKEKLPATIQYFRKNAKGLDNLNKKLLKLQQTVLLSAGNLKELPGGPVKAASQALSLSMAGLYLGIMDGIITFAFEKTVNPPKLVEVFDEVHQKTIAEINNAKQNNTLSQLCETQIADLESIGDKANEAQSMNKKNNPALDLMAYKQILATSLVDALTSGIREAFLALENS